MWMGVGMELVGKVGGEMGGRKGRGGEGGEWRVELCGVVGGRGKEGCYTMRVLDYRRWELWECEEAGGWYLMGLLIGREGGDCAGV